MTARLPRLMIAPLVFGAAFLGLAGAQPALAASTTSSTAPYSSSGPTLTTSSVVVTIGGSVSLTATGCKFPESFVITIHSVSEVIGHANSQPNGDFNASVTIPSNIPAGDHTIVATGSKGDVISAAVVVETAAGSGGSAGSGSGSGALATTGTYAAASAGIGAAAIAIGGLFVLGARRRRRSAWTD